MHDQWTAQFSAYLDDELGLGERRALEAHLAACAACRGVLDEVAAIVRAAREYQGSAPPEAVWQRVAASIDASRTVPFPAPRVVRFSLGQLVATAATVAVLAGGGAWLLLRPGTASPTLTSTPAVEPPVQASVAAQFDSPAYDQAVRELEATLAAGRGQLDTATVRIIEESLRVIDTAIAEARAAIDADPSNAYLGSRIQLHRQRKLELLRQAARAAGAAS